MLDHFFAIIAIGEKIFKEKKAYNIIEPESFRLEFSSDQILKVSVVEFKWKNL